MVLFQQKQLFKTSRLVKPCWPWRTHKNRRKTWRLQSGEIGFGCFGIMKCHRNQVVQSHPPFIPECWRSLKRSRGHVFTIPKRSQRIARHLALMKQYACMENSEGRMLETLCILWIGNILTPFGRIVFKISGDEG